MTDEGCGVGVSVVTKCLSSLLTRRPGAQPFENGDLVVGGGHFGDLVKECWGMGWRVGDLGGWWWEQKNGDLVKECWGGEWGEEVVGGKILVI